jgi:hypothetical protein
MAPVLTLHPGGQDTAERVRLMREATARLDELVEVLTPEEQFLQLAIEALSRALTCTAGQIERKAR